MEFENDFEPSTRNLERLIDMKDTPGYINLKNAVMEHSANPSADPPTEKVQNLYNNTISVNIKSNDSTNNSN